jgi:hypothetical protein
VLVYKVVVYLPDISSAPFHPSSRVLIDATSSTTVSSSLAFWQQTRPNFWQQPLFPCRHSLVPPTRTRARSNAKQNAIRRKVFCSRASSCTAVPGACSRSSSADDRADPPRILSLPTYATSRQTSALRCARFDSRSNRLRRARSLAFWQQTRAQHRRTLALASTQTRAQRNAKKDAVRRMISRSRVLSVIFLSWSC